MTEQELERLAELLVKFGKTASVTMEFHVKQMRLAVRANRNKLNSESLFGQWRSQSDKLPV